MYREEEYDHLYKVVLSGDCGVGKSNILQRYIKGIFTDISPTIGVEFATRTVKIGNGAKIKAHIWDTAGCDRYRSITTGHYRRAQGALLVYDITNEESFTNLTYWLQCLREYCEPEVVIALIANKCDIMFEDPARRETSKEQAIKFADENNLIFVGECSARSDINIKETIEALLESRSLLITS